MFFFIALFVAGFILTAFMSPKMKIENAKAAKLDDFSFPRANEGDPVGRVYGTVKLPAPNTISLSGFKTVPIKKKVKTGLFSSKKVITGYKYYTTVDLAWALGPGIVYKRLWFGENLVWVGCLFGAPCYNEITLNLPELYGGSKDGARGGIGGTIGLYCGEFDQDRDPYLVANMSADVPAYVGIAHAVFRDFWFGNQASIDTISMEVACFVNALGGSFAYMENGLDANPIHVLYDIFATEWGNLGYDPAKINVAGWQEVAQTIYNEGNGISISIANATEAKDAVKTILRQINGMIYEEQTTGLVELRLIRNDYDIEDLPVLGPSEILEVRNYSKKLWSETNNVVRIKYEDRDAGYVKDKIAIAKDFALLRFQGKQRPVEMEMPGVKVGTLANEIAARELSNLNVPLYSCELTTNRMVSNLRPGDPFVFEWPEYGIELMVMRVRKMGQGTLEDGRLSIGVVQDEFAVDATVIAAPAPSEYDPGSLVPVDIDEFRIFELPAFLDYNAGLGTLAGNTRIATFVKAPSSYTLGYDAMIQAEGDDVTALTMAPYTTTASLVSPIARFDGWTDGVLDELIIEDISNIADLLDTENPRLGGNLIMIGNELFVYETAVDNEDGTVALSDIHRSMFDTGWFAHIAGATVYVFDGQEGFFDTDSIPGEELALYLIDRTAAGSSSADDATVSLVTPIGRVGRVIAPDYATADGNRAIWPIYTAGDTVSIGARARSRLDVAEARYEDDAADVAEAGTTYRISVEVNGDAPVVVEDDVALPYDLVTTEDMVSACVVLIHAKKDGLYSIAAAPMPINVASADSLEIDSEYVTIDGETVEFS